MIPRTTSRPMKSASASGPMGWLSPTRAPVSMSSAVATPSSRARIASATNGMRIRLTMKPGRSAETITCLPSSPASARTAATVASSVAPPRISSTRGMTGTGLKKCIPQKASRRPGASARARRSTEIELVFVAKMARPGASPSSSAHSASLTASSSKTASTTRSASATEASRSVGAIRSEICPAAASSRRPFATARSRLASIRARPASARASSGSYRSTVRPAVARTWAIPWPIRPAPATNARSIDMPERLRPVSRRGHPGAAGAAAVGRGAARGIRPVVARRRATRAGGQPPCTGRAGDRRRLAGSTR